MSDEAEKTKVVGMFGQRVTLPGITSDLIFARADKARALLSERKIVGFAAVAIDEEGLANCFFSWDMMKSTVTLGGMAYMANRMAREIDDEMSEVTPPEDKPA